MHVLHRRVIFALAFTLAALGATLGAPAQTTPVSLTSADPHSSSEWALIAPHLPDPLHASPGTLETAGDVLRARRFPQDAILFYKAAFSTGGNANRILKKQGVVHLELQHGQLARLCFQQAVRLNKKDSEAWNNLGAADFMLGNTSRAVGEYKKAVKLNRESAVFRSNLALGYFEVHDSRGARRELARAVALDPDILHRTGNGGYNLQILGSAHYAEICFEMARVYASGGDRENTIEWLTKASERGYDVRSALGNDALLHPYLEDDRIRVMLLNNDGLRSKDLSARSKPPGLSNGPVSREVLPSDR